MCNQRNLIFKRKIRNPRTFIPQKILRLVALLNCLLDGRERTIRNDPGTGPSYGGLGLWTNMGQGIPPSCIGCGRVSLLPSNHCVHVITPPSLSIALQFVVCSSPRCNPPLQNNGHLRTRVHRHTLLSSPSPIINLVSSPSPPPSLSSSPLLPLSSLLL